MVDYTTKTSSRSSTWLYIVAAGIVVVMLFALFAGGGTPSDVVFVPEPATTVDPAATVGVTD